MLCCEKNEQSGNSDLEVGPRQLRINCPAVLWNQVCMIWKAGKGRLKLEVGICILCQMLRNLYVEGDNGRLGCIER